MNTSVSSVGIVPQLLTIDNYERWSVLMKNYLMGKGLWDFVSEASSLEENSEAGKHLSNKRGKELEATSDIEQGLGEAYQSVSEVERDKVSWKKKNAKALHIIQISCGQQIQDELVGFETARSAWDLLAKKYGNVKLEEMPVVLNDGLDEDPEKLFRRVERGDYIGDIIMHLDVYMTWNLGRTLLHAATMAGNVKNVEMLVEKGRENLVHVQDHHGNTALGLVTGNIDIAKCIIEKGKGEQLLILQNKFSEIPVLLAADKGYKEMTRYLYSKTPPEAFDHMDGSTYRVLLLERSIRAEIFDVALKLLKRYPDLFIEASSGKLEKSSKFSGLVALAKMPSSFPSGSLFPFRVQFIYNSLRVEKEFAFKYGILNIEDFLRKTSPVKCWSVPCFYRHVLNFLNLPIALPGLLLREIVYWLVKIFKYLNIFGIRKIYDKKYAHYEVLGILENFCRSIGRFNDLQCRQACAYEAMLYAAQNGIIEFINAMSQANPVLLSAIDSCNRDIFWYAILNRRRRVFQLIYGLNESEKEVIRYRTDTFGNNLLHMAAHLGSSSDRYSISGAAFQMQREIHWFKAVEEVVHPMCKENKNREGKKPGEIFTENHEELVKAAEKWTKEIATSYIGMAYIIITIMFAAVFTVPGGNNQDTGSPIFLHDNKFNIFLVADALSIIASASSLLVFIGIHTSRYTEVDFHKVLLLKLMFGLHLLVLSFLSMMMAFYAALQIIIAGNHINSWSSNLIPILALGCIPIIIIVLSQLRFISEIFYSTIRNPISSI